MSKRDQLRVDWVGIVVRTSDGNVHAVELHGNVRNFVTADLIITRTDFSTRDELDITATIRGKGRYWREGAGMTPSRSELVAAPRAIEER